MSVGRPQAEEDGSQGPGVTSCAYSYGKPPAYIAVERVDPESNERREWIDASYVASQRRQTSSSRILAGRFQLARL
jgi:hypothetical protein